MQKQKRNILNELFLLLSENRYRYQPHLRTEKIQTSNNSIHKKDTTPAPPDPK